MVPTFRDRPLTAASSGTFPRGMHRRNRQMADAGCELFMLLVRGGFGGDYHTSWFWRDDGAFGDETDRDDGLSLDDQARSILEARPEAVFTVRWSSTTPAAWAWSDPAARLGSATVPTDTEWRTACGAWMHWPSPEETQRYRDYFAVYRAMLFMQRREELRAVELGKASVWWHCNRAGLVLKEFGAGASGNHNPGSRGEGDYAIVFPMATPLPAALLRSLALYGGCVPWSVLGGVVAANGSMVAVHTMTSGPRVLRFPHPARVTDALSGALVAESADRVDVQLQAPGTGVWLLDPPTA